MKRLLPLLVICLLLSACHSTKKTATEVYRPGKTQLSNSSTRQLVDEAYSWLGTPYLWAGETKRGADCSGFVMKVFDNALGIKLPRNSRAQSDYCTDIDRKDLVPGDLVFFTTNGTGNVSHVGIYVGDGHVIHASSSRGVTVSSLSEKYYDLHYHHSGRVVRYAAMISKVPPEPAPERATEIVTVKPVPEKVPEPKKQKEGRKRRVKEPDPAPAGSAAAESQPQRDSAARTVNEPEKASQSAPAQAVGGDPAKNGDGKRQPARGQPERDSRQKTARHH